MSSSPSLPTPIDPAAARDPLQPLPLNKPQTPDQPAGSGSPTHEKPKDLKANNTDASKMTPVTTHLSRSQFIQLILLLDPARAPEAGDAELMKSMILGMSGAVEEKEREKPDEKARNEIPKSTYTPCPTCPLLSPTDLPPRPSRNSPPTALTFKTIKSLTSFLTRATDKLPPTQTGAWQAVLMGLDGILRDAYEVLSGAVKEAPEGSASGPAAMLKKGKSAKRARSPSGGEEGMKVMRDEAGKRVVVGKKGGDEKVEVEGEVTKPTGPDSLPPSFPPPPLLALPADDGTKIPASAPTPNQKGTEDLMTLLNGAQGTIGADKEAEWGRMIQGFLLTAASTYKGLTNEQPHPHVPTLATTAPTFPLPPTTSFPTPSTDSTPATGVSLTAPVQAKTRLELFGEMGARKFAEIDTEADGWDVGLEDVETFAIKEGSGAGGV